MDNHERSMLSMEGGSPFLRSFLQDTAFSFNSGSDDDEDGDQSHPSDTSLIEDDGLPQVSMHATIDPSLDTARSSSNTNMQAQNLSCFEVYTELLRDVNIEGDTCLGHRLVMSAFDGDIDSVTHLISDGCSVNAEEYNRMLFYASKNYITPLQAASANGHLECVKTLIQRGGLLMFYLSFRSLYVTFLI